VFGSCLVALASEKFCESDLLPDTQIEKDIAQHVKTAMEELEGGTWHCIVGANFGSSISFSAKHCLFLRISTSKSRKVHLQVCPVPILLVVLPAFARLQASSLFRFLFLAFWLLFGFGYGFDFGCCLTNRYLPTRARQTRWFSSQPSETAIHLSLSLSLSPINSRPRSQRVST